MSNYLARWNNFYLNMMTAANSPILTSKAHWRSLAKEFRLEAWLERSCIRATAHAAQLEAELLDMTQKRDSWYDDCKKAEAERDIYNNGFDALTTVCDKIVKERNEANRRYSAHFQAAQQREEKLKCALAQHQATRRELLDTIAALKRENEAMHEAALKFSASHSNCTDYDGDSLPCCDPQDWAEFDQSFGIAAKP